MVARPFAFGLSTPSANIRSPDSCHQHPPPGIAVYISGCHRVDLAREGASTRGGTHYSSVSSPRAYTLISVRGHSSDSEGCVFESRRKQSLDPWFINATSVSLLPPRTQGYAEVILFCVSAALRESFPGSDPIISGPKRRRRLRGECWRPVMAWRPERSCAAALRRVLRRRLMGGKILDRPSSDEAGYS